MNAIASLCILGAGLSLSAVRAQASGTLLAHWKFDAAPGTTTAVDSGPSGFTGTLQGAAAFVSGGVSGNAVIFNRSTNDYVDMGSILPFTGNVAFSVSAWMKSVSAQNDLVVGRHDAGYFNGYILATNAGSGYGLTNKAWAYVSSFAGGEAISASDVIGGAWHHLVLTFMPGGNLSIFVDGRREATRGAGVVGSNPADFMVGGVLISGAKTGTFTGEVDDVQVYSGALTGPQVCAIFNNPGQPAPPSCDGDVNVDHAVNFADLNIVLSNFGLAGACLAGDADGDGDVDFADLNIVLSAFGIPC